jgi:hypothetical protein
MSGAALKPEYVNKGSYGCVFSPAAECANKSAIKVDKNMVSKVFYLPSEAAKEENEVKSSVSKLDPEGAFTVKFHGTCFMRRSAIAAKELFKCGAKYDYQPDVAQLLYDYGGYDLTLSDARSDKLTLHELVGNMRPLFEGLVALEKHNVVHRDIKCLNTLYNPTTGKAAIIDFGLAVNMSTLYSKPYNSRYDFHPPEFNIYNLFVEAMADKRKLIEVQAIVEQDETQPLVQLAQNYYNFFKVIGVKQQRFLDEFGVSFHDLDVKNRLDDIHDIVKYLYREAFDGRRLESSAINREADSFANRCDVYMMGLVLFEVMARLHGKGGIKSSKGLKEYVELVDDMTRLNPLKRLTPMEALDHFEAVQEAMGVAPMEEEQHRKGAPCPPGKERNPATGRCIKIKVLKAHKEPKAPKTPKAPKDPNAPKLVKALKEPKAQVPKALRAPKECPPGKERNPATGRCVKIKVPKALKEPKAKEPKAKEPKAPKTPKALAPCPPGKVRNPATGRCKKA